MSWLSLATLVLTLPSVLAGTCPSPDPTPPISWNISGDDTPADALAHRLSIGFVTEDQGFRLDSFKETARALARSLDYELWIDGLPMELRVDPETATGTPRPRLVALSTWDKKGEALAAELGVDAVLVVKSASSKKGKQSKKRYGCISDMYPGANGTAVTYIGLSYRVNFEVHVAEPGEESTAWREVSSWRVTEDEREAPKSILLSSAVDGKITLTLSDVILAQTRGPVEEMARTAAFLTMTRLGGDIAEAYAGLSEGQRTEFWIRAAECSVATLTIPIDTLLQLAFTEWKADAEPAQEELDQRAQPETPKGPTPPGPQDSAALLALFKRSMSGSMYFFGSPLLRSTQNFVYRWSGAARNSRRSPTGLEAIDELFAAHRDLPMGSRERAETLAFGQA